MPISMANGKEKCSRVFAPVFSAMYSKRNAKAAATAPTTIPTGLAKFTIPGMNIVTIKPTISAPVATVMNPPFSEGDKHLAKALDLQQHGGMVVCLLNAETLRKPYTKLRKTLKERLKELA